MGKLDGANQATNASLSVTLDRLVTEVEVSLATHDRWEPLTRGRHTESGLEPLSLTKTGLDKLWRHVERIRTRFGVTERLLLRTGNNFPSDCGIASSASSFAAITEALAQACAEISGRPQLTTLELSALAREGSGSSCRSFFSPFSIWRGEAGQGVGPLSELHLDHFVVIVESALKDVSSSEAHRRVSSSSLFLGRVERAERRLEVLQERLQQLVPNSQDRKVWREVCELVWIEFWDMHALFETSEPPFGYFTPGSVEVLTRVRRLWREQGDGPMATMDAGANVHLLWRPDQMRIKDQLSEAFRNQGFRVLVGR
jgi:diphosphomevalonate decarboxylase